MQKIRLTQPIQRQNPIAAQRQGTTFKKRLFGGSTYGSSGVYGGAVPAQPSVVGGSWNGANINPALSAGPMPDFSQYAPEQRTGLQDLWTDVSRDQLAQANLATRLEQQQSNAVTQAAARAANYRTQAQQDSLNTMQFNTSLQNRLASQQMLTALLGGVMGGGW